MNTLWDAAQAALALVQECLGASCVDYPRRLIETQQPVADCATLAVQIGPARAHSGSCVGKLQLNSNLDIHLIRCCEPVGDLSSGGGYTPPSPAEIESAAACLVRDVWAIYQCLVCTACDVIGSIPNVTACCDEAVGPPEIIWNSSNGGCRSAIIRLPLIFTTCCVPPAPPTPLPLLASSPDVGVWRMDGSGFSLVDHVRVIGAPTTENYYDPAGPNAGLNPASAVILVWSDTRIEIQDYLAFAPGGAGETATAARLWGVGDVPDYGVFDYPDFAIQGPVFTSADSPASATVRIQGSRFDVLDHVLLEGTINLNVWDPAGPNAAGNAGVVVSSWTPTEIRFSRPILGGKTAQDIRTNDVSLNATWDYDFPDFVIQP